MWFVVKGGWPQMILLFLIMRCTPTIRELIEATPLSPSSPSATRLAVLAPAQRAGAQRLCSLTQRRHRCPQIGPSASREAEGALKAFGEACHRKRVPAP